MKIKEQMKNHEQWKTPHQLTGRRKSRRPLDFKTSTHLVLRLKEHLPPLFEPRDSGLRHLIFRLAQKYHVRIYRLILNHSHMHAVVLLPDRRNYNSFIREVTSVITRHFTQRLNIFSIQFRQIFKSRPFTRSTPWGRAFKILLKYMDKNERESGWLQKAENEFSPTSPQLQTSSPPQNSRLRLTTSLPRPGFRLRDRRTSGCNSQLQLILNFCF